MEVKRNKKIGLMVIGACFFLLIALFLGSIVFNEKMKAVDILCVLIGLVIGVSNLKGSLLTLTDNELILHAAIGPLKKRYQLPSTMRLSVDDERISILENGKKINLPIRKWQADPADWNRLIEQVKLRWA